MKRIKQKIKQKNGGNGVFSEKSLKLSCIGAGDGTRTRDTLLGRQELYH
jgi:hypothetical protein